MRVLFVTYWFPPSNEVGAVRTGKFAESLLEAGHELRVLTGPPSADRSIRVAVPEELIERVQVIGDLPRPVVTRKRMAVSRFAPVFLRRHYRALRSIPDSKLHWKRPGLRAGTKLLQGWRPDVIVASGPPYTALLIARALSTKFRVPLVAELRDPWTRNPYVIWPAWREWVDRVLEWRTLNSARGIVAVSPVVALSLRQRYCTAVETFMNGYDPDALNRDAAPLKSSTLSISYFGRLYNGLRDPSALFAAIALLGSSRDRIHVTFYGPDPEAVGQLADQHGVAEQVSAVPQIPYDQALSRQNEADVLLLLQRTHRSDEGNIPAKFFEYMAARRPILLIGCPTGIIAGMIRDRQAGVVLNEPEAIAAQLSCWIEQTAEGIPPIPMSALQGLSRAEQFARYEAFLRARIAEAQVRERL